MFGGMMEKLQKAQQEMEESKERLSHVIVDAESTCKTVFVEITANGVIKKIDVRKELSELDKEELEDLLIMTLNKGYEKANTLKEQEMARVAQNSMPNIPGLGM